MINRRRFVGASAAGFTMFAAGTHLTSAETSSSDLPFQNASFIRTDLSATPVAEATAVASPVAVESPLDTPIELTGYLIGDPDAPHTLSLFADYRCPHCRRYHKDLEPTVLDEYVAAGKFNLELIDFTVVGIPSFEALSDDSMESVQAAEAAAAAAEQGKFLEYREWLYTGPDVLSVGDFSDENLIAAAVELGLDEEQFSATLTEGIYEQDVIDSFVLAFQLGVPGTPTMTFDRGEPFNVADGDLEGLKAILDEKLAGA
ncbi:MAG: DsbA family protein [Thermomicrobiales bacterium]|nr:DsbA family protein [Thermomicrobiales bacterium]MCO5218511.1 DsbA family protein [Thermomicrobiales bacterium]MCO5224799.1 DsbA family protein [Thermomicrobiales bacterium]MCO5227611.1 DsbA family protein [Thermomicrobiales bacterium]